MEAQRAEEQQQKKKSSAGGGGGGEKEMDDEKLLEGLPIETSPYVKYSDVEDYKRQGYGTEGHVQPKLGLGGGATDAPTPSGSALPKEEVKATHDGLHTSK
ncbi:Late embryogenesis abundant protein [Macleaya cordata]|uniref:Late embryogenesis abundant protein n=1 Tax=Macleaya cordata TaxID=56857 RepID=A0A200QSA6_MACCD|nr:Late embryogenesis abundant protein [Macleaya cordata]